MKKLPKIDWTKNDGLVPAVWVGAGVLAAGSLLALAVPGRRPQHAAAEAVSDLPSRPALVPEIKNPPDRGASIWVFELPTRAGARNNTN